LEAAVDAELDAADSQPLVAFVLAEVPGSDRRLHLRDVRRIGRAHELVDANRQEALLLHLLQDPVLLDARTGIPDARQARGIQLFVFGDEIVDAQSLVVSRQRDERLRAVHQLAVQLAAPVSPNPDTVARRRPLLA